MIMGTLDRTKTVTNRNKERLLIHQCCLGDQKAAEAFIRQFSVLICHTIRQIFSHRGISYTEQDLEDLHNSVFLRLFSDECKRLRLFKGDNGCSLASWLKVVTVNHTLNSLRKQGPDGYLHQINRVSFNDIPEILSDSISPQALMESREQYHLIKEAVATFGPRERLFFQLHYLKHIPLNQLSEIMHESLENMYSIKHRFISRLKKTIAGKSKGTQKTDRGETQRRKL